MDPADLADTVFEIHFIGVEAHYNHDYKLQEPQNMREENRYLRPERLLKKKFSKLVIRLAHRKEAHTITETGLAHQIQKNILRGIGKIGGKPINKDHDCCKNRAPFILFPVKEPASRAEKGTKIETVPVIAFVIHENRQVISRVVLHKLGHLPGGNVINRFAGIYSPHRVQHKRASPKKGTLRKTSRGLVGRCSLLGSTRALPRWRIPELPVIVLRTHRRIV